jgi:quercetin dioxygenase-like cupin family protein
MHSTDTMQTQAADVVLDCDEFNAALNFYTTQLGFRLDVIFPADNPRTAVLTGFGICLQLEHTGQSTPISMAHEPSIIVNKASTESWGAGRAGMQYRDLIPDRLGGKYIASHIRIPEGGPVPDYVHHHHVKFQMIYCYKGWVRVVYEDQGPPLKMQAGDCVLQPPHIRHRVLECSDGMEVVEIAGPAEHETFVEHNIELPTASLHTDRNFDGQEFVFHQATDAEWLPASIDGFEARDIGINAATNGVASVIVLRLCDARQTQVISHNAEFFFNFVLQGTTTLHCSDDMQWQLSAGDSFVIPHDTKFEFVDISADLELLQVALPGDVIVDSSSI